MSVAEGRNGKITIRPTSGSSTEHTIAEMGEWSISGISRNMIDFTAFGDTVAKHKPGMLDPGTISFSGWYDATDSTGQASIITLLTSGTIIASSSNTAPWLLKLWTNDDSSFDDWGYFRVPAAANSGIYITSMELGTNKDGLCSVNFTGKITGSMIGWTSGNTVGAA